MIELKDTLAENITWLRNAAGMTQAQLAERLHYSDKSVSKWERGEGMPDVSVLVELASIFDVTTDYLVTPHAKQHLPRGKNGMTRNHRVITEISLLGVLYSALMVFTVLWLQKIFFWQVFVGMIPVAAIVYLVLNSVWGKRKQNVYVISVLLWGLLATIYFLFTRKNLWLLFVLGIPAQAVTVLSFMIRLPTKKEKRKRKTDAVE